MTAAAPTSPHFVNRGVDFMFIAGISLFMYAFFSLPVFDFKGDFRQSPLHNQAAFLAVYVSWIINWPHFSATSWRLYRSAENRRQFPVTSYVLPFVILACIIAALSLPETVAPWWAKLFLLWSPYHFSAQSLGITLLYARRHGFPLDSFTRKALWVFIFGAFLFPSLRGETGGMHSYYGLQIPTFGIPESVATAMEIAMLSAGAIALFLLIRAAWRSHRHIPLMVLAPGIAQYVWFVGGSNVPGFLEFVPAFHSLQYLYIAWFMHLSEKMGERGINPSPRYAVKETGGWLTVNLIGGAILFAALPWLGAKFSGLELFTATGIVIAGVQIHHFFVDGVIWKLKNPKVAAPIMASLPDIVGKAT